jgi:putative endonuclease
MSDVGKIYYIYIMSSQRQVLYIGFTSDIHQRVFQHKAYTFSGFTARYIVTNLVYFERYGSVLMAFRREKAIKDWCREQKIALIESSNPNWRDLSYGWYQPARLISFHDMNSDTAPQYSNRKKVVTIED